MSPRELNKLLFDVQKSCDRFTNVRRIIDFRNRLTHGYASVSPQVVWRIVSSHVPVLLREVRSIIGRA